jgi:hypothetical protein
LLIVVVVVVVVSLRLLLLLSMLLLLMLRIPDTIEARVANSIHRMRRVQTTRVERVVPVECLHTSHHISIIIGIIAGS